MRYLILLMTLLFAEQTFAGFYGANRKVYSDALEACQSMYGSKATVYFWKYSPNPERMMRCDSNNKNSDWITLEVAKESKCKNSQELEVITVPNMYVQSVCYQGCTYKAYPKGSCVTAGENTEGVRPGRSACDFTQTATSCTAEDGDYSALPTDKAKDKGNSDNSSSSDFNNNKNYCETRTYNSSDPYFTKCANTDKNGNPNNSKDDPTPNIGGIPDTRPDVGGSGNSSDSKDTNSSNDKKDKDDKKDKSASDPATSDDKKDNADSNYNYPSDEKVPERQVSLGNAFKTNLLRSSQSCPSDTSVSLQMFGFSAHFSYAWACEYLAKIGMLIMIGAYIYASNIVLRA